MSSPNSSRSGPNRFAAGVAILYFLAMAVAVTFPGVIPFNRARPFLLGVPLIFTWYLAWIAGAFAVFLFLYRSRRR